MVRTFSPKRIILLSSDVHATAATALTFGGKPFIFPPFRICGAGTVLTLTHMK